MVKRFWLFFLLIVLSSAGLDARLQIVWPTPNPAYANGEGLEAFIQPTVSGRVESGLFGCARNSGARFHEALDLKPVSRDRRGEAADPVVAVMDGVVVYVNRVPGNSGYGRYVVIEHREVSPAVVTLYAHLSEIRDEVEPGGVIRAGQRIGIMGRSAGGYSIPKERAHLHFEMGVWISESFQEWYDWKGFGSKNTHGLFNGMNITGFDPLDFYDRYRDGSVTDFNDYFRSIPVAYVVRVKSDRIPDFLRRYPAFFNGSMPRGGPAGWEIGFTATGIPKEWKALAEEPEQRENARIVWHDLRLVNEYRCLRTVVNRAGNASIGPHTERSLQLMFGFRR